MNRTTFLSTLFATMMLFGVSHSAGAGDDTRDAHRARHATVAGSWEANIDLFGTPLRALFAFHLGGTLTESDNPGFDPNFGGFAFSPGLGAWQRTGHRTISARYRKLAYSVEGVLEEVATSTMRLNVERDGSLGGTISIEIALPDGTVVAGFSDLVLTATRILAH